MDSRRRALLAALMAGSIVKPVIANTTPVSRKIPSSGEALPVVGLGTWQTFDVGDDAAARAPLRDVLKLLNGNLVDSSPMYGSSEAVAGDLIAELKLRERLFIATKVWARGKS